MRPPTRILHLVHWMTFGGVERWLLSMLREVDRERYQMDICCKGPSVGPLARSAEELGARIWHLPLDVTHVGFARRLRRLIASQRYDVVHNHLAVYAAAPTIVARMMRVPTIVSFHNTDQAATGLHNPFLKACRDVYGRIGVPLAMRVADVVTGCSDAVLQAVGEQYGRCWRNSRVLHYGVDIPAEPSRAARNRTRRELGVPAGVPLIAHVGRFDPQKNHSTLVEIAAQTLREHPDAHFVLVGDGRLRSAVEDDVRRRGLTSNVHLVGVRDDVEQILGASDVFLLPSHHEGLAVVALEAQAAALPIVGSNIPGIRSAVVDGETALLFPLESPLPFVRALSGLIGDPSLRSRLGRAGRRWASENFARVHTSQQLCRLYDDCLTPSETSRARACAESTDT